MSLHLFTFQSTLHLLCAYENGAVVLRRFVQHEKRATIEGKGWETVWSTKLHVETVMSMAISEDKTFALTVSADNLIGQYALPVSIK
jgi:ASTRA-associated protein 1